MTAEELVSNFLQDPNVNQYNAKARLKLNDGYGTQKATLFIRAKQDSVIWMVIKKFSVEAARVLITHDSLFIINRLQKEYQLFAISELQNQFGVTPKFDYIYKMLLGTVPDIDTTKHWELNINNDHLTIETMIFEILHKFRLNRSEGQIIAGSFMDNTNLSGNWQYDNYQLISDSISLPYNRNYSVILPEGQNLNVNLDFSEIELNIDKTINFKIPHHYRLVP